jgi:hypothetical protein
VPLRNLIIPSMPLKSLKFLMCHPFYVSFLLCHSVQLRLLNIVIFFTNDCLPSSRETASVSLPTHAATSGGSATTARRTIVGPSSSSSLLASTPMSSPAAPFPRCTHPSGRTHRGRRGRRSATAWEASVLPGVHPRSGVRVA